MSESKSYWYDKVTNERNIMIEFPEKSYADEQIKQEIRMIMREVLHEQLQQELF